ncbi:MAG: hypothetical protein ABSF45_17865, partial [Terriglobia bacterium]
TGPGLARSSPASPVFSSRQFDGLQQELSTLLEQELLTLLRHIHIVCLTKPSPFAKHLLVLG